MALSFVLISKWTSRKWFPILAVVAYLGESATDLYKHLIGCPSTHALLNPADSQYES